LPEREDDGSSIGANHRRGLSLETAPAGFHFFRSRRLHSRVGTIVPKYREAPGSGKEVTVDDSAPVRASAVDDYQVYGEDAPPAVLVVDDERSMVRLLRMLLEADGFAVFEAMTGPIGLGLIPVVSPKAVVLDVMMPGMDGVEVCRQIASDHPDLPVIILTGRDDPELESRCMAAGARRFMNKPLLPGQLTRVLDELLDGQVDRSGGPATVA
jgi:CheY-like chemotaxis protein